MHSMPFPDRTPSLREHEGSATVAGKDKNNSSSNNEAQESKEAASSDSAKLEQRCRPSTTGVTRLTLAEWTSKEDGRVPGGDKSTHDNGGCGRGAEGIISLVEGERPSTAPMHSDGKVGEGRGSFGRDGSRCGAL